MDSETLRATFKEKRRIHLREPFNIDAQVRMLADLEMFV